MHKMNTFETLGTLLEDFPFLAILWVRLCECVRAGMWVPVWRRRS